MEAKKLFLFFKEAIPPDTSQKFQKLNEEGSSLSREILFINRQIICLFAANRRIYRDTVPIGELRMINSASVVPCDATEFFGPIWIQSTIFLLSFLNENLDKLAEAVSKSTHLQMHAYIMSVLIPMFFSYFSNNEAANRAYTFYIQSIQYYNKREYLQLIKPFYAVPSIWKFIDNLFRSTIWSNYMDRPDAKEFTKIILIHTANTLYLLPTYQLNLIILLTTIWDIKDVWDMIIRIILIPQLKLEELISPFTYTSPRPIDINEIIEELQHIVDYGSVTLEIKIQESMYEIPDAFVTYGNSYSIEFIITLADVHVLLSLPIEYPSHITRLKTLKIEKKYHPFRIRIFPKENLEMKVNDPLIFENIETEELKTDSNMALLFHFLNKKTDNPFDYVRGNELKCLDPVIQFALNKIDVDTYVDYATQKAVNTSIRHANIFELYLDRKLEIEKLRNWIQICKDYIDIISFSSASREVKFMLLPKYQFDLDKIPEILNLKHWYTIVYLQQVERSILEPFIPVIEQMEKSFSRLILKLKLECQSPGEFNSERLSKRLWEANGIMSFVSIKSNFMSRFIILMNYLNEIEYILKAVGEEQNDKRYTQIISFCVVCLDCDWILRTSIYLHAILLLNDRIIRQCDENLIDIWKKFSVCLMSLLSHDEELLEQFFVIAAPDKIHI